jgi:hypothetical protein
MRKWEYLGRVSEWYGALSWGIESSKQIYKERNESKMSRIVLGDIVAP